MKKKLFIIPIITIMSLVGCTKYNGLPPEEAEHVHTYAEVYSYDAVEHWLAATCEHEDQRRNVGDHTFGEYVVAQEPTLSAEGLKVRTCSVCGYKDEVKLDKITESDPSGKVEETWNITGINANRESVELTIGESPISVIPTIVGEGKFPTSISVYCPDMEVKKVVEDQEVTENVKVAQISSNVVESGTSFTVSAVAPGNTKIILSSVAKEEIKKEINVVINAKVEHHDLTLEDSEVTLNKGSQYVLLCSSTDNVTWTSSDSSVVALENKTNSGVWLKALKSSGENAVTISATICDGTEYKVVKTCQVTVVNDEKTIFDYYFINNQSLVNLKLYMWDANGSNAAWPGVPLLTRDHLNKNYEEVYKITIDRETRNYEKMIISGEDLNGKAVQTDDILFSSFTTQNAFTIPSLPDDVLDGVRKASVKLCTFDPAKDSSDEGFVSLSMTEANLISGEAIDVVTYTSESAVTYSVTSGADVIELSDKSKNGFKIKGLQAGSAEIEAKITNEFGSKIATMSVTVEEDEKVTYYFANNYDWKNLKIFLWGSKGTNGDFPGTLFSKSPVKNRDNIDTYEITFGKMKDGYTGLVISGMDDNKGWSKTDDIIFADLDAKNENMISITETEWTRSSSVDNKVINHCSFGTSVFRAFEPYVEFREESKTIFVGETVDIPVDSNADFGVVIEDDRFIDVTKSSNKITVTGVIVGSTTVTVKLVGNNNVKDTIRIEVINDKKVSYYFMNEYEWTDVKAYFYIDDSHHMEWPGQSMTLVDHDYRHKEIYGFSFMVKEKGWKYVIFSGYDTVKGERAQTVDIPLDNLKEPYNCAYVTGWNSTKSSEMNKPIANIDTLLMGDYISFNPTEVTLKIGDSTNVSYLSSKDINITVGDSEILDVIKGDGYIQISAKKAGETYVRIAIGEGFDEISDYCHVTVKDPSEVTETTYKIKLNDPNILSWLFNSNPVFYAWVWGGNSEFKEGTWIKCTYENEEFTFTSEIDDFAYAILCRCKPETGNNPNWADVWNKSDDLTFNNYEVLCAAMRDLNG